MSLSISHYHTRGFSLMELIGVMAVMAILAGALAPSLVDSIDRARRDAEEKNLQALAESLQQYILANKRIPTDNPSIWVKALASQSSIPQNKIALNVKNFRRRLIFDPRFFTATDQTFPGFTQNQGLATAPVSPRIMLISDLTRNVPPVTNTSAIFNSIWEQSGTPSLLESHNLKIVRINLAAQFHRVVLSNQDSAQPFYQLENGVQTAIPPASGGHDGTLTRYVLTGSRINLYSAPYPTGALSQTAIIRQDVSMRYQINGATKYWIKQ